MLNHLRVNSKPVNPISFKDDDSSYLNLDLRLLIIKAGLDTVVNIHSSLSCIYRIQGFFSMEE